MLVVLLVQVWTREEVRVETQYTLPLRQLAVVEVGQHFNQFQEIRNTPDPIKQSILVDQVEVVPVKPHQLDQIPDTVVLLYLQLNRNKTPR